MALQQKEVCLFQNTDSMKKPLVACKNRSYKIYNSVYNHFIGIRAKLIKMYIVAYVLQVEDAK
jgi:hypothetical protein